MKKFNALQDIKLLFTFFLNDALHGILNHTIWKNRWSRWAIISLSLFAYISYFLLNMIELGNLVGITRNINEEFRQEATRITLVSIWNGFLVFGIFSSVLLRKTVNLSKSSDYIIKSIPFSKASLVMAQKLFRGGISLVIFMALFVIVVPTIKLFATNLYENLLFVISIHFIYLVGFYLCDLIYQLLLNFHQKLEIVLDVVLMFATTYYIFSYKHVIDVKISQLSLSLLTLITLVLVGAVVFVGVMLTFFYYLGLEDFGKDNKKFVKFLSFSYSPVLPTTLNAIFRTKNFWHTLSLTVIYLAFISYQADTLTVKYHASLVLPMLGIVGLYYADSTAQIRKLFNFLRVGVCQEIISLLIVGFILVSPTILLTLIDASYYQSVFFAFIIYLLALNLGLIFPRSKGNLNETVSFILLVLFLILYSLSVRYVVLTMPIIILLIMTLVWLCQKERSFFNEKSF